MKRTGLALSFYKERKWSPGTYQSMPQFLYVKGDKKWQHPL